MTLRQCLKRTSKQIYGKTNTDCLQHCDQILGLMNTFIYIRPSMSSSRCSSWIQKGQRNQRSNCQHSWIIGKESSRKTSTSVSLTMLNPLTVQITTNWKIPKEMGIPDHLTCLLEICMQVKKQQLEPDLKQQTGSKLGKEYIKAVYCHPAYLTHMQNTSCKMLGWMKHKLESRLLGEISITSDMQMTPPLLQKVKKN